MRYLVIVAIRPGVQVHIRHPWDIVAVRYVRVIARLDRMSLVSPGTNCFTGARPTYDGNITFRIPCTK
jgi:hypothetical protein